MGNSSHLLQIYSRRLNRDKSGKWRRVGGEAGELYLSEGNAEIVLNEADATLLAVPSFISAPVGLRDKLISFVVIHAPPTANAFEISQVRLPEEKNMMFFTVALHDAPNTMHYIYKIRWYMIPIEKYAELKAWSVTQRNKSS